MKVSLTFSQVDCCGCHTCEVACKQEHGLPVGPRIVKVIERAPLFMQYFCHHCEDAPCALSCPEEAIKKDPETGVMLHDREKCNGCNAVEGKSGIEKQQTSPCKFNCPAHNDIQGFMGLVAKGKYLEALRLLKETSPFPSICGRVCTFPCESECNRNQIDEQSVSIRAIERFLADQDRTNGNAYVPKLKQPRTEKIAIAGSGPAGLAAAYFLAKNGYRVTVFEKLPVAGGMMAVGIPLYRLPRKTLATEIGVIQKMGVEIKTGVTFGRDVTFDGLKEEGYKAFFLATGLHQNIRLNIENEDANGVLNGIDFLRNVSLGKPVSLGKKVIAIGGGNVAMDVAMTAARRGAEVSLVALEQRGKMPAWEREINEAEEEGIKIVNGLGPNRFIVKGSRLSGAEFRRCTSVFNETGAFSPKYDDSDLTVMDADAIIVAIGQAPDIAFAQEQGLPTSAGGHLKADPITLETTIKGVFAGGDVYYGPKTVVEAIGCGKEASVSIDRYLRGLDLYTGREPRDSKLTAITQPVKEKYDPAPRAQMTWLPVAERMSSDEVQIGLAEQAAFQEAKRCISCGTSCVQACPYGVMQFNHEALKAVKCDLCLEKRLKNEAPACTWACPAHCIYWGDETTFPSGIDKGLQTIVP